MSKPRGFTPSATSAPVAFGPSGSSSVFTECRDGGPGLASPSLGSAPSHAGSSPSHDDWRSVRSQFSDLGQRPMTVAETGARLFALLCAVPSLLTHVARQTFDTAAREDGSFDLPDSESLGELLPLPMPRVMPMSNPELDRAFPQSSPPSKRGLDYGAQAWLCLAISALNHMGSNGRSSKAPRRRPSPAQQKAIEHLYAQCGAFTRDEPDARMPTDWIKDLGNKAYGYWGDPVYTAEPIRLLQVLASLPARGVAGSVDICHVLDGQIRDQLRDPESLLLPESDWPHEVPSAKTNLEIPDEWLSLAQELWERDLVYWLPESILFAPYGRPLVNGLFAVPKDKEVPGHPGLHVQRLICNLVPSNAFFRVIRGDVDHLPYIMQWSAICLAEGEVLTVSQEDMTCAFYLFALPEKWCPYFAVGHPVRLSDLKGNAKARATSARLSKGSDVDGPGYICLRVLPMGWLSAVGVMQSVHRRILSMPPPQGAGLGTNQEIRKTSVLPTDADQRLYAAWQVYLDNYASVHIRDRQSIARATREINAWHQATRHAWLAWGIPSAADKSVSESLRTKELGCLIDGDRGALGTTASRRLMAIGLSLFLITCWAPHRIWLATGCGRWNFCFQFRRATSCVFFEVWQFIARWQDCSYLPAGVAKELLCACFLAPLMETDLRARPDLLVTCSDASEAGAGICASVGLSSYGVEATLALPPVLPPLQERGFALLSMFGGIEASCRACHLLGIVPIRHVTVEIEKTAIRATAEVFPEARAYRDIKEYDRKAIHESLAGANLAFVLIIGGSPCQGLSGANATGTGFLDDRSRLFFEFIRVIRDVQAEHHSVLYAGENVTSMTEENRDVFSSYMGTIPHRACASGISQARRDRFYWLSWRVPASPGVTVERKPGYFKVRFEANLPPSDLWADPGWVFCGSPSTRLPTFMRSIPKKKQTFLPAGIASTPADARRRWVRDAWRFPPYQYKKEFLMRHKRHPRILRVTNANERERLMFLGTDTTRYALNPVEAKRDPIALEDARSSLIGNSFHAGVLALLLAPLFFAHKLLSRVPTPSDMVARMGLRPGEVYVEGMDASLSRPAGFHRHDGHRRGYCFASQQAAVAAIDPRSSPDLEAKLFHSIIRASDYRGSDVRLDSGELFRPHAWPRRSIDPARWNWYAVLAAPYRRMEHINALELKATFLTLRWRLRSASRVRTRFLHLVDSQVALSVLVKGRSSSWVLNRILTRVNALTLAAGILPSYAYVMSEWNPSDRPSRRFMKSHRTPASAFPRKPKPRASQRVLGIKKDSIDRRNQKFSKKFDASLGYPGEGPASGPRQLHHTRIQRVLNRQTIDERRRARQGISLRDATLAPLTVRLYREAFSALWQWIGRSPPEFCLDNAAYDSMLSEFIEHCWEGGQTRALAGNALSGSLAAYPELRRRGSLNESWFFLQAWSRIEIPNRAPPMPPIVLLAFVLFFIWERDFAGAFLLAAGFDGFLRTNEMLDLQLGDVLVDERDTGVLNLRRTKSGQRNAAYEAGVILDPLVGQLWRLFSRQLPAECHHELPVHLKPKQFHSRFAAAAAHFHLSHFKFRGYSIRRGGATSFYRRTGSMPRTIDRGRWATAKVARIYVTDGLSKEIEQRFTPETSARLDRARVQLLALLDAV